MKKLLGKLFIFILLVGTFAFGQTQNPTGKNYQLSGNGSQVQMTNGVGTAGLQPCYDGFGNLTPTCSTAATGLGVYLFTSGRQDTGCLQILVSEDGKQVRPLQWPLDPYTDYTFCGGGIAGTAIGANGAGGMFSSLFHASWNSSYYVFYNDATQSNSVGVASSSDLVNWAVLGDAYANGTPSTLSNAAETSVFYDAPAQCAAQDYTCLHVIVPIVLVSSSNYQPYEIHPTNASLTAWSSPVQLGAGVVYVDGTTWSNYVVSYSGTYYLFGLHPSGAGGYWFALYSASSLTGTYSLIGNMQSAWCRSGSCTSTGQVETPSIVYTGTAWRAYLHPSNTLLGSFYVENSSSPVATSGWTTPFTTQVSGVIDQGDQQIVSAIRDASPKTISIVAATARQSVLPLWTPRGLGNCDAYSDAFNTPGTGGPFQGICAGMEHVNATQQGSHQGLRLFAENPNPAFTGIDGASLGGNNGTTGHIDFGHYTNPTAFTTWLQFTPGGMGLAAASTPSAVTQIYTNASSTGTTNGHIAKLNGTNDTIVKVGTSDTEALGIVVSGGGTTGTAVVALAGTAACTFDNASTAGYYVQISTGTAGDCTDAGATLPSSGGTIIGRVADGGTAGSHNVAIALTPPGGSAASGVTNIATTSPITGGPITTTGTIACATCVKSAASLGDTALVVGSGGAQGTATGNADFTYATHTLTGGASGILDLHAMSATAGFLPPAAAGAAPTTAGAISFDTTPNQPVYGDGSVTHHLNPTRSISFQFGTPGGTAISTGILGYYTVPFACTITGWSIEVDAGTATVKTLKVASGTAIPTLGSNSISTSGVAIASGTVIQSTTVSDFTTTTVTKNDIIAADLITTSGVGYIDFQLLCVQ